MNALLLKEVEVDALLNDVFIHHGYDFTQYNRCSIHRRLNRICLIDKFTTFTDLRNKVLNDAFYFKRFIAQITVNVTTMFRDPSFFKALREEVLPKLGTFPLIRIWVAGCSTGEEVYALAILLKEAKLYDKSLIYATDINPSVLKLASQGVYHINQMKLFVENYRLSGGIQDFSSYYKAGYNSVSFNADLKKKIVFATHNLVSDRSFNSFQLIVCRNVLIYFNKSLQNAVFKLFDESMDSQGYLALGDKETIRFSNLESAYSLVSKEKIWRKVN